MSHFMDAQKKAASAGILLFLLLFILLLDTGFVAHEQHHHCTGSDCPICKMLAICEQTLHQIGGGKISLQSVEMPFVATEVLLVAVIPHLVYATPVLFKVRLNH